MATNTISKEKTATNESIRVETYRAMQISAPGRFELVERAVAAPTPGRVRIRVEACGVCHSDFVTVQNPLSNISYPRVPGHEAIGKIDAVGDGVSRWKVGQRVGVGYLSGPDFQCEPCLRGDFVDCQHQGVTGASSDGGYAEVMMADQRALVAVPEELTPIDAAPLVCAGVTTYNALRNSQARAGDLVAIQGIGGLGHLGIQYARTMGFRVAAIGRGGEKKTLSENLGAHHYIDTGSGDVGAALQALGGAKVILATAASSKSMGPLLDGLAPRGRMVVVGVGADGPIEVSSTALVFGSRAIEGALTGSTIDTEDTLNFSVLQHVRPMTEIVPLEKAATAYARMMSGHARFRMVLVTGQ